MPAIDQVPSDPTVVVLAVVEWVPSVATTEIVSPASPVPLAVVLVALAIVIGLVTDEKVRFGTTVFFVAVIVCCADPPPLPVAVTVYVIVPSVSELTLIPTTDQVPSLAAVVVWAVVELVPSVATTEIVAPAEAVPEIVVLSWLAMLIGFVTEPMLSVVLVLVSVACDVFPLVSVAVAVYVIVPSLSPLTLMPLTTQLPADVTVVVCGVVLVVPSVATTEIVAFAVPVPLAVVLVSLETVIGLVTDVMATDGAVAAFVVVLVAVTLFDELSVAVARYVIVPSLRVETSMPEIDQVPPEPIVVVWAVVEFVPSVTTTDTVAPASPVPLIVVECSLAAVTGLVTELIATVVLVDVMVVDAVLPEVSVSVAV